MYTTKEWLEELCPEIAPWQVALIAEAFSERDAELADLKACHANLLESLLSKSNIDLAKKVEVYETLLHKIQMHADVTMNADKVAQLIRNICNWSYAHRCGNGEHSEEEQAKIIQSAFDKLLETKQ